MLKFQLTRVGKKFRLSFPYDELIVAEVKALPDRFWNPDRKCWVIGYSPAFREFCRRNQVKGWRKTLKRRYKPGLDYRVYVNELDTLFEYAISKGD